MNELEQLREQDAVHWRTRRSLLKRIDGALAVIDRVETRCMAVDGPVTPTLDEMREDELRELVEHLNGQRPSPEKGSG